MLSKLVTTYPHFCSRSSAILRISANNSNDARPTVSTRQTGQAHQLQTCRAHAQTRTDRPINQSTSEFFPNLLPITKRWASSPEPSAGQAGNIKLAYTSLWGLALCRGKARPTRELSPSAWASLSHPWPAGFIDNPGGGPSRSLRDSDQNTPQVIETKLQTRRPSPQQNS